MLPINSYYEIERDHMALPDIWRAANNHCPAHYHSLVEIVCALGGAMQAHLDSEATEVKKGEVMVVSSYTIHRFETAAASDVCILQVPTHYIQAFNDVMQKRRFAQSILPQGAAARQVGRYMKDLLRHTAGGGRDGFVVRGLVYAILGLLMDSLPMEDVHLDADHDKTRRVLGYLHRHYTQPVSLDELADAFGYSRSRFSHLFSERLGYTVCDYLGALRCHHAAQLLRETDLSVSQIAMAVGFESLRTFYRTFKKQYKLTPNQYALAQF